MARHLHFSFLHRPPPTAPMRFPFDVDYDADAWMNSIYWSSNADARRLLRPDQDVNERGAGGQTAMHVLARYNQLETIQTIMLKGADPSVVDSGGHTPLRIAQIHNHTEVVRCLIHHDELVRALAKRLGRTPVPTEIAAVMKDDDLKLRSFRREVYERVEENSAKLVAAARNGDLDTVRRMVEGHESTIDAVDGSTRETAFAAALAAKRTRVIEYLLAHDANVFAPCIVEGKTEAAVTTAVAYGDVSLVRRFAGYGSLLDVDGLACPLAEAMKLGSIEMVKALFKIGFRLVNAYGYGTGVKIVGTDGRTLYNTGSPFGSGNPPSEDESPWRLLEFAYWLQDTQLIRQLYETFDVLSHRETMARLGGRALVAAVCRENEQLVTDLLDRGTPINGERNHNAMAAAVLANSVKMLRLLLSRGGDITVSLMHFGYGTCGKIGLLANALNQGGMDCAYELLLLETRPWFLDEAFIVACKLGQFKFVNALLDTTLPSTPYILERCITSTSCPLVLDLLLPLCDIIHLSLPRLNAILRSPCFSQSAEITSVLLAHGISDDHRNDRDVF